jgi:hypothetical protein
MSTINGRNLPPPQSPFVDPKSGTLSTDGYQYLLSLLAIASNAIQTSTVATGLTATGTNQPTALALFSQWNEVDTVAAGTGVLLQALQPGKSQTVFNRGANNLNIYPPPGMTIGSNLGTGAVNAAYLVGAGTKYTFDFYPSMQIRV